ncbi:MAG: TonB-dependent receptor [Bacteroidetes bacterium]|nr:TonB-dependent receptor [Bacteroidota bacterium]
MKKNLIILKKGAWLRIYTLLMLMVPAALFGQVKITGTITDASDGTPLPGASILIQGTTTGVISDANGNFAIDAPATGTLIISYMGYLAETIAIEGRTKINVILTPDLTKLDEVVVIGYGTMKKSDLTGAVSSVKEEDIKSIKSSNAVEALQGKVAGVDMTRSDGRAGSDYNILIRGARSFSANNDPIYIVDGIDYGSNININPNDIASMEVLKDASATAIYGSRGASGVILITTKKGNQGKPVITFNTYYGYTTPLGELPMGNADYYLQMTRDIYRTTHPADWETPDEDIPVETLLFPEEIEGYNNGTDFDWVDEQMKDHGNQMDYYLSIAGGSEKTNYSVSLNHFREDNFIPNDNYKRYSIKTNIDSKVRKWLDLGNSTFLSYTLLNRGQGINYNFIPLVEPYDSLGNLIVEPNSRVPFTNMLFDQDPNFRSNENSRTGIFSSFYGQLNLLPGLSFRSTFNVNLDFQRIGDYSGNGGGLLERQSTASVTLDNNYKWTWTNVLTYDKTLGSDHHFIATAATETRYSLRERYYQEGQNLMLADFKWFAIRTGDDAFLSIIDPDEDHPYPYVKETMVSFIGRLHYGYKGKYLATLTGRYDGASQLVEKWDFFPSVSVAWKISEEDFMKGIDPVSNLKLRVGYGQTGNSSVKPYQSMGSTTDYQMYYQFGVTETTMKGYRTGQLSTIPRWESTTALNLGLDFGLFRNRISGSVELYSVHTYDILQEVTLPPTSAVGTVLENIGETKGKGVEITLNTININTSDFKWSTGLTFARSTEEITYLAGGVTQDVANKWFVGEPLNVFYDWKKTGIWQTEEAEEATKFGAVPGDIKLQNTVATSFTINDSDRVVLGTPRPKWTGGLNSTMNYKNIDFSFFIYARVGNMIMDVVDGMWSPDGRENSVDRNYWTPNNPTSEYPRVNPGLTRSGWSKATTLQYTDGSFVKVKDITLGYTIPQSITGRVAVSALRIYVSAKNYLVFGKYFSKGRYDPESIDMTKSSADDIVGDSNVGFPAAKMLVVGANVTF